MPPLPRPLLRFALLAFAACAIVAPPTQVFVSRTPVGDHALHEAGAAVGMQRWDVDVPGLKRGFHVVKSEVEWRALWPEVKSEKIPLLPADLDFSREMLLIANPTDDLVAAVEVKDVIETNQGGVHAYVTETLPGVDCPPKPRAADAALYDLVRVRRIDNKDVKFHLDAFPSDPCGAPPQGHVRCRPTGAGTEPLKEKLEVGLATTVSCVAQDLKSTRSITDLTWTFASAPKGTYAKLRVSPGGRGASFTPDSFGSYDVGLEISDDLGRIQNIAANVLVAPPADALALQMVWTKRDASDDLSTLPRVELHALGDTPTGVKLPGGRQLPPPPIKWGAVHDCSVEEDRRPAGCTAKPLSITTILTLDPTTAPQFAVAVHYTDERFPGGAVVCVRTFRRGVLQGELCDDSPRKENTWWEVETVDAVTGKKIDPSQAPSGDAGAADAGARAAAAPMRAADAATAATH